MQIKKLIVGPFEVNTYILISEKSDKNNLLPAIIIDPGCEYNEMQDILENLDVKYILNTHGHFDHIIGNSSIKKIKNSKIIIHKYDSEMLTEPEKNLSNYFLNNIKSNPADIIIEDENFTIELNEIKLNTIFVPGHTEGSIAFYFEKEKLLFSGDFIFENSIGRTDFPNSNHNRMIDSLKKISNFPDDITVFPGHENFFLLGEFKKNIKDFISF